LTRSSTGSIDLGTTNTVVAFAPIDTKRKSPPVPAIFEVPQLVSGREVDELALLPSALYAPLAGEVSGDPAWVVGELARRRGSEVTGRFVASAKSWLSHTAVDRLAAILPWGSTDATAPKLSPVDASTRILAHIRKAWDEAHGDAPLAEQDVALTLPASFDDVARELTLSAAKDAGITPTLLEEPTAAFYDAMRDAKTMRALARSGDGQEQLVLVVDVGGGTTDLSLMAVGPDPEKKRGAFAVRRVAVGRHILLGGDNMDLALAHLAEPRIATGGAAKLEAVELAQLVHGCRDAKERILSGEVDEARVTVLGRGSRLVGGARGTTLKREEVERIVLGGFFPEVKDLDAEPQRRRAAIVAFGLPYEREPAITRHVKQFLARHSAGKAPDALLLNGGVFNASPIVEALVGAIGAPELLPSADPDLAVAKGAVLYAFARRGLGIRVESGASRGYYVALSEPKHAVCILPRGAGEGVKHEAAGRTFELVVGRNVRFDLFSSDVRDDVAGTIVEDTSDEDAYEKLPPVVARMPPSGKNEQTVPVVLGGELLTTGQLELACIEKDGSRRFRLEFQLRENAAPRGSLAPTPPSLAPAPPSGAYAAASGKVAKCFEVLVRVFGKRTVVTRREVKYLVGDLEMVLVNRLSWTLEICRALGYRVLAYPGARRR
jgi:molecular chaperone DnaK (HSP70)